MVRLMLLTSFILAGACSAERPDTVEKAELRRAYEICFAIAERDVGVDLREPDPSGKDEREHYHLARMRIIAAVNKARDKFDQEGVADPIELPYLIALENGDRFPEHYPRYDHECVLTPEALG